MDLIARYVIPDLKKRMYINIWDAGCAMGPEPYSIAITLRENMGPFLFRNVRIYATDIDESGEFGQIIARGVFPAARVKRIPPDLFYKYFSQNGNAGYFEISDEMKKAIIFQRHDLLSLEPIRDEFGLVVCKNVLLHFAPQERAEVIEMFHGALSQGGYLVTEQTQKLPPQTEHLFRRVTSAGQLFQKVQQSTDEPLPQLTQTGDKDHRRREATVAAEVEIKKDDEFSKVSDYTWMNLEVNGERIGKARVRAAGPKIVIYSMTIFPGFERNGYAQKVVDLLKESYKEITADRVRSAAKGFWGRMGFVGKDNGDYVWKRSGQDCINEFPQKPGTLAED